MADVKKHPSGRPIRRSTQKRETSYRQPRDCYITPNLQTKTHAPAIGFTARLTRDDDEE